MYIASVDCIAETETENANGIKVMDTGHRLSN